jgi:TonB-linked SusC/RagA family outer membrane protein
MAYFATQLVTPLVVKVLCTYRFVFKFRPIFNPILQTKIKSMRKVLQWKNVLTLCFSFLAVTSWAQERMVSGRVSSDEGFALPGVNVVIKGSTSGTITDANGSYTLSVPSANGAILVYSFVGFTTQEIEIGTKAVIDVQLVSDVTQLSEIVVTSQGIEKDSRSLGYSLQSVNGAMLAQRSETNLLNSLQGKVAGVNIVGASGAPGASTNINIRGITSFGGNNQPLIVVDGIIFNNSVNGGASVFTTQPSNRLADIAPETIESINILKGPAAAALYGSRASNGAIIITTKSGKRLGGKTEVTLTSSVNFQNVFGFPEMQNTYGQGTNNDFLNTSGNSWGPAFGGALTEVTTLQGATVPYQAYANNVKDFFKTGKVVQNGLNIASGNADNNVALSISTTLQDGVIPNSTFDRNSFSFGGNSKMTNGLLIGSNLTYVNTKQTGNPQGNGGSALGQITRIPRSYDLIGSPYKDQLSKSIYYNTAQNHPLWSTENETFNSTVDRFFGNFKIGYNITDWLNVTYRVTADTYTDRRKIIYQIGSARNPTGRVQEDIYYNSELNGDLLITASKDNFLMEGLNANVLLGHNINQRRFQNSTVDGQSLTIPFFTNVSNASVFTSSQENSNQRRLVGYYAQANLSYNNYLFLELTGRADQSSTLPKANNTYFYPAASAGFVLTDAFSISSDVLSYAKVRASAARVGNDAGVYLLNSVYGSAGYGNNLASITFPLSVGGASVTGFTPGGRIGSNSLKPEFVTSYDGGLNVQLFDNKVSFDVGYFYTKSTDQIFNVAVSNSSGFSTRTTNIGLMTNKGWEGVVSATPLKIGDFSWEISANFTRIRNRVVEITPEDIPNENSAIPGISAFIGMTPSIYEGQPYGVVVGNANARNANGELLINPATGLFATTVAGQILANPNPDWLGGLTNTFSYKGLVLSVLLDVRYGGQILSFGNVDLRSNGNLKITEKDRDKPRILPGVIDNGDGTFRPNNIQISAQAYWQGLGGLGSEASVFDATVYRLREMSLSYNLPSKWFVKTPITGVNFGLSGRNLWFHAPGSPSDPEVNTQGAGNVQGLDQSGAPNTKNYGANLRITF